MSHAHLEFRYSVTIQSDDLAVVHCLRALNQFAQKESNLRIGWGGTKEKDWARDAHKVTFRFTRTKYRDEFLREAHRLLPQGSWREVGQSDADPAKPR